MANRARRSFDTGLRTHAPIRTRLPLHARLGGHMRRSLTARALVFGALAALMVPATASADVYDRAGSTGLLQSVGINSSWVLIAGILVMFMQAGFAFLEIGFSRGKNAGTIIAKILVNFSIAAILYWAVGFAFAFGGDLGHVIGTHGFFLRDYGDPLKAFPIMGLSDATIESKFFFQFVFCAVSLAIVWGTTLERVKFGVYVLFAIVFSALIYPIASGWARASTAPTASRGRSPATTCRCSAWASSSCGWAGSASTRARRSTRPTGASPRSCSSPRWPRAAVCCPRSPRRTGRRRPSTSAWRATARSPRWWPSPRRRAT